MHNITAGSVVSILVMILSLVEITPIKLSPLAWIGDRLNKRQSEKLDALNKRVDKIEGKQDDHIAQSYRDKILMFQDDLLTTTRKDKTQEAYDEVLDACEAYETHCKKNDIKNDKCTLAIGFIKREYQRCQDQRAFRDLPTGNEVRWNE